MSVASGFATAVFGFGRALRGRRRDDSVLSTKVGRQLVPSPETANSRDCRAAAPSRLMDRAQAIAAICSRFGIALPDASAHFTLPCPELVSVVRGTRTAEQEASGVERHRRDVPDDFWNALVGEGLLS